MSDKSLCDPLAQHSCQVVSDRQINIDVEPDDAIDGAEPCERPFESLFHNNIHIGVRKKVRLKLTVDYPDDYPDALPELRLEAIDGEISESESDELLKGLLDMVRCGFSLNGGVSECVAGRREQGHGDDVHIGFASQGKTDDIGGKPCKGTHSSGTRKGASGYRSEVSLGLRFSNLYL